MAAIAVAPLRGALLCGLAALLLASCGSERPSGATGRPTRPAPTVPTAPMVTTVPTATTPPACGASPCQPRQTVGLGGGYQIRLWLGTDQQDYRSRPVVELLAAGRAVQSWAAPKGDGWNGTLTCRDQAVPNCILLDSVGMHASIAELLIVRDGRLSHPASAEVVADSPGMQAADLDADGYLDVVGTTNDYSPNYAQGHNYWQTFRYDGGRFELTGCARRPEAPAPTRLLTGTCPPT